MTDREWYEGQRRLRDCFDGSGPMPYWWFVVERGDTLVHNLPPAMVTGLLSSDLEKNYRQVICQKDPPVGDGWKEAFYWGLPHYQSHRSKIPRWLALTGASARYMTARKNLGTAHTLRVRGDSLRALELQVAACAKLDLIEGRFGGMEQEEAERLLTDIARYCFETPPPVRAVWAPGLSPDPYGNDKNANPNDWGEAYILVYEDKLRRFEDLERYAANPGQGILPDYAVPETHSYNPHYGWMCGECGERMPTQPDREDRLWGLRVYKCTLCSTSGRLWSSDVRAVSRKKRR